MKSDRLKIVLKVLFYLILSLGMLSNPFLVLGVQYNCSGDEMFPVFYASPFVFKSTSLATSLAFDYYLLGVLGNMLVWMFLFLIIDYVISKYLSRGDNSFILKTYQFLCGLLFFGALLIISFEVFVSMGTIEMSFDLDNHAQDWGMICEGELLFFE